MTLMMLPMTQEESLEAAALEGLRKANPHPQLLRVYHCLVGMVTPSVVGREEGTEAAR